MNDKSLAKLELDSAMRKGLENDQFFVQYQPRIDTRTDTLIGCEALVRWRHPQHGTISPGEFIGIAEETGFIVALDEWVLKQVCRQARRWRDMGLPAFYVSVNVSGLQFRHPGLVDSISEALATCALDPSALHVEITEGLLMRDTEQTLGIVKQINDMGIRVEIDDFGVGFSSLSYLNRFPVDALKIDLSFVRSVPLNRDNTAITKAIVSMAHSLELGVVAEGVETVRERDYLKSIGCFEMQGFLFSRAVDPDELEKIVRRPVQRRNESVMGG